MSYITVRMQCKRQKEGEKGRLHNKDKGKQKIKSIPESIYLPRKHFPTKQRNEETGDTQSRGQLKAHKGTTD